ncbi:MAG: beta-aspartyl-peptidase [Thermoplasmata archaeon]
MIVLKNLDVYSPEYLGINDILISNKIESITREAICEISGFMDLEDHIAIPGIIDIHNHIAGGGGEGGFEYRTYPVTPEKLRLSGITTVVGVLGTDGITRNIENLLAHAKLLRKNNISAFLLTGSYKLPPLTLTGSVEKDIMLIEEIIGLKIAVSDHRGSYPDRRMLINYITEARRAGILSGKPGYVNVHLGNGKDMFRPLIEVIENTDIPADQIVPTHVDRNRVLLKESIEFLKLGGRIDLTGDIEGEVPGTIESVKFLIKNNADLKRVTVSSDGNGSKPVFDENGRFVKMSVADPEILYNILKYTWNNEKDIFIDVLRMMTENPGEYLKLKRGKIDIGYMADMLILDRDFNKKYYISNGVIYKI